MQLPLADEVVILRAQVDYLLERLADNPGLANRPVSWRDLSCDDATEQWAVLTDWVTWLRRHYGLHERVPACWYTHAGIREELSALRSLWVAAYQDKEARPGDGVAFHDALDRVLYRISHWDICGCNEGTHHDERPAVDHHDQTHLERVIHADLAARER